MPLAIEVRRLTKVFYPARPFGAWLRAPWRRGEPIRTLDDVSLTIEPGELVCLMGPNGAGKTTLLKILVGLLWPTSGTVRLDGCDVRRLPSAWKARVGFASSDRPGFYDQLTGRQNLEFFGALMGLSGRRLRDRIEELVELLDIRWIDRQYQECSAGMKQRVLLARALLREPSILLLDEPTKSLDPLQTARLHEVITQRLHRDLKKTILLTTQRLEEAQRLAQALVILHRGTVRVSGTMEVLRRGEELGALFGRVCADG